MQQFKKILPQAFLAQAPKHTEALETGQTSPMSAVTVNNALDERAGNDVRKPSPALRRLEFLEKLKSKANVNLDRRAFEIELSSWVASGPIEEKENRHYVAEKFRLVVDTRATCLELCNLKLTSLPQCLGQLSWLQELKISGNRLTQLPKMPPSLRKLFAGDNRLTCLPTLPPCSMVLLNVEHNYLTHLPRLPPVLRVLIADSNYLDTLPPLQPPFSMISLHDNWLKELPEGLERAITKGFLKLTQNPLLPSTMVRLQSLPPTVDLIVDHEEFVASPPEICRAFEKWNRSSGFASTATLKDWTAIAQEPKAYAFKEFLDDLPGTAEFRDDQVRQEFIARVSALLDGMHESPALRDLCFEIAERSIVMCLDLVTAGLNDMCLAKMQHDAEKPTCPVDELLKIGRTLYAFQEIDGIYFEKLQNISALEEHIDKTELQLRYRTFMAEALDLQGVAKAMLYEGCAGISDFELNTSVSTISDLGKREKFLTFMANWPPWQRVQKRASSNEISELD